MTKEIEDTKKKKWLLRQKFKLVNKLRKHGGYQKHSRMVNNKTLNSDWKMPHIGRQERSMSNVDNWNKSDLDIKINTNMIDASVSTGPDMLLMLTQLK